MLDKLVITLRIIGAFFLILAVSGIVSDFIFPHWKRLNDWINALPMMQEYENSY